MTNSLWLVKLARICVIAYSAEFLKKKNFFHCLLNVCIVYFANSFLYFCCFFFLFMFAGIFAFFHLDDQRLSMAK